MVCLKSKENSEYLSRPNQFHLLLALALVDIFLKNHYFYGLEDMAESAKL